MRTSRSASRSASSLARTGLIVEQSISIDPGRKPSASPCSPKTTASTSGESRTHVTTMSLAAARSLGLAASVAPSSTSGPARPGVRFHTASGKPARARLAAMAAPIVPKPAKPTLSIGPTVEPTGDAPPRYRSPPASPVDMSETADRFRRLAADFTATVDAVPDERWDDPSPCEGWSARDVVRHVATTEWDFLTRLELAPAGVVPDPEPLAAWPTSRDAVQAVLDDPARADTPYESSFGPTTFSSVVDRFYAFDLIVHAWDIARAVGLPELEPMPADEIARVTADAEALGEALRSPGVCGPPVPVPDDADAQSRLLGFLGRQP